MRPVPVLLFLMQPAAQQRPAAQAKAAQGHGARRARRDGGAFAPGRRLRQLAWRLRPS
jgi:hypothetical protein